MIHETRLVCLISQYDTSTGTNTYMRYTVLPCVVELYAEIWAELSIVLRRGTTAGT